MEAASTLWATIFPKLGFLRLFLKQKSKFLPSEALITKYSQLL